MQRGNPHRSGVKQSLGSPVQTIVLLCAGTYFTLVDAFLAPIPFPEPVISGVWIALTGAGVVLLTSARRRRGSLFDPAQDHTTDPLQPTRLRRSAFVYSLRTNAPPVSTLVGLLWIASAPEVNKVAIVAFSYLVLTALASRKSVRDPELGLVAAVFADERLEALRQSRALRYEHMLRLETTSSHRDVSRRDVLLGWMLYVGTAAVITAIAAGLIRIPAVPAPVRHHVAALALAVCTAVVMLVAAMFARLLMNRIDIVVNLFAALIYLLAASTWILASAEHLIVQDDGVMLVAVYAAVLTAIVTRVTRSNIGAAKGNQPTLTTPMAAVWLRGYQLNH